MRVLLFVFMLLIPAFVFGQEGEGFKPPRTPTPMPDFFPSLNIADMEVDSYIEVSEARSTYKVSGKKLAVAVIDSGINPYHDDFKGRILPGENFTTKGGATATEDFDGHGSNVGGIVAGNHDSAGGIHPGIAYDAKIVPLKVFYVDSAGKTQGGRFTWVNKALKWVLENQQQGDHLISVVNLSLGTDQNLSSTPSLPDVVKETRDLIKQLRAKNIVVTVSAGNDYKKYQEEGMGIPAIFKATTSVGAIYDTDIPAPSGGGPLTAYANDGGIVNFAVAGRCTVFSQRLSKEKGGDFATDICAPGFIVTSAGPVKVNDLGADDEVGSAKTQTVQDGTSQASPVCAGVVLLLQEHYNNLTRQLGSANTVLPPVDLIEECLREGGKQFTDEEDEVAQKMDDVVSSGTSYHSLNAKSALAHMSSRLRSEVTSFQSKLISAKSVEQWELAVSPDSLSEASLIKRFIHTPPIELELPRNLMSNSDEKKGSSRRWFPFRVDEKNIKNVKKISRDIIRAGNTGSGTPFVQHLEVSDFEPVEGLTAINVASYNLESGDADIDVLAEEVEDFDGIDIWGFSEVDIDWADQLEESAGEGEGAEFDQILGSTGGNDRLMIVYNTEKLEYVDDFELHRINPRVDGRRRVRSGLVGRFKIKATGQEFLFMVNHLYRGRANKRHEQATLLNEWASSQEQPIIGVGDYNFDWEVNGGDNDHDLGYDRMVADDVFKWVRPETLAKTQKSPSYNSVLDFVFASNKATPYAVQSTIIVRDGDIPDTYRISDHRPVTAQFKFPEDFDGPNPAVVASRVLPMKWNSETEKNVDDLNITELRSFARQLQQDLAESERLKAGQD